MEKLILRGFFTLGLGILPAIILRKKPAKDWLIVFFFTGFLANLLDDFLIKTKRLAYPVRLFKKLSDKSILFDYLIFPITCTLFIQTTYKSKLPTILGKVILFTFPLTILEWILERNTRLIKWIQWSPLHTFVSVTVYFLSTHALIKIVNKLSRLRLLDNKDEGNVN